MFLIKRNIIWIKNSDYLVLEYIINKGQIGEEIYDELNHLNNEDIKTFKNINIRIFWSSRTCEIW